MSTKSRPSWRLRLQCSVLLRPLPLNRSTALKVPATSCHLTMMTKAGCMPASRHSRFKLPLIAAA